MRANSLSQTPSCDVDFWQKDFAEVLSENVQLRQDLGKFFDKTIGSEGRDDIDINPCVKLLSWKEIRPPYCGW